jgi:hypothetical protein
MSAHSGFCDSLEAPGKYAFYSEARQHVELRDFYFEPSNRESDVAMKIS